MVHIYTLVILYLLLLPAASCAAACWCVDPFRLAGQAWATAIKLCMMLAGAGFFLSQLEIPAAAVGGICAAVLVLGTMNELRFTRKFSWPRCITAALLCALFLAAGVGIYLGAKRAGIVPPEL